MVHFNGTFPSINISFNTGDVAKLGFFHLGIFSETYENGQQQIPLCKIENGLQQYILQILVKNLTM
jgi:hypothetical protein